MSESPKRRIEDLLSDWLIACGTTKRSQAGTIYSSIRYPQLYASFEVLLEQLLEEGYDEKYIKSAELNTKIGKTLLPDHLSIPNLNHERVKRMSLWYLQPGQAGKKTVVGSHFRGKMGTPKDPKIEAVSTQKSVNKKTEIKFLDSFDLDEKDTSTADLPPEVFQMPKDMIQLDSSDVIDAETDWEFIKELEEVDRNISEGSGK